MLKISILAFAFVLLPTVTTNDACCCS